LPDTYSSFPWLAQPHELRMDSFVPRQYSSSAIYGSEPLRAKQCSAYSDVELPPPLRDSRYVLTQTEIFPPFFSFEFYGIP